MCLHVICSAAAGERKNVSQSEKDQKSQWSHRGGGGRRILIGKRSRVNSCTEQQWSLVLEHSCFIEHSSCTTLSAANVRNSHGREPPPAAGLRYRMMDVWEIPFPPPSTFFPPSAQSLPPTSPPCQPSFFPPSKSTAAPSSTTCLL